MMKSFGAAVGCSGQQATEQTNIRSEEGAHASSNVM